MSNTKFFNRIVNGGAEDQPSMYKNAKCPLFGDSGLRKVKTVFMFIPTLYALQ
jgi:hypothetical protein